MTYAVFAPRRMPRHGDKSARIYKFATVVTYSSLLAALLACGSVRHAHAKSNTSVSPSRCNCAVRTHFTGLQAVKKSSGSQAFTNRFKYSYNSPVMNVRANSRNDDVGDVFALRPALLPPKPVVLTSPILPTSIETRLERRGESASKMFVGIASMYDPGDPSDCDSGDGQTASGEMYDASAWTAAIRADLRDQFGGVRYGKNYRPSYVLLEVDGKRAIVKINDVGPLAFGRIIDLNKRTMRYFDPSLQLGLIHDMRVIPLPGTHWAPGQVGNGSETIKLAGDVGM